MLKSDISQVSNMSEMHEIIQCKKSIRKYVTKFNFDKGSSVVKDGNVSFFYIDVFMHCKIKIICSSSVKR